MDVNRDNDSLIEQEAHLIAKINSEREKIAELLRNSSKEPRKLEVFEKYFLADQALLEIIGNPEVRREHLEEEPLPLLNQLQAEAEALSEELFFVEELATTKNQEKIRLRKLIDELNITTIEKPINDGNIDQVEKNVRKRFKLEKARLKQVLSAIWPMDTDTRDLIAQLVTHGVNSPGDYLPVDEGEGISERISVLLKTNLFELNPGNAREVRLVDLT